MLSKTQAKYIQSLLHKKFRDQYGVFIAEGPKVVNDLLTGGDFSCKQIFAVAGWIAANAEIIATLTGVEVQELEEFELKKISALTNPHEVLAIFEKKQPIENIILQNKISLLLDNIQDPGNLGTIIRSADWFGVTDIICSIGCADIYNPKVVQGTMGSLGRVNIVYVDAVQWLKENKKVKVYAADLQGTNVFEMNGLAEGIIIIGNEGHGINKKLQEMVDVHLTIPRKGKAESLNAAIATAVILSSVCR